MRSSDIQTVSVVMPVHAGVAPPHLRRALQSLVDQTRLPDELVLVEDGPLTGAHQTVIGDVLAKPPFAVQRILLATNGGAGVANGAGLRRAAGSWIAKADADDINVPNRLERQLAFVGAHHVDVCGAAMAEFGHDEGIPIAIRPMPAQHDQISKLMRMNSPINHPTSFYRRDMALRAGGYSDMRYMQDYDMFARMMVDGATFANLQEPLVWFRADEGMYRRRTSSEMRACEWRLQHNLHEYGVISLTRMWTNLAVRLSFRYLPRPLLRVAYQILFHRGGTR